MTPNGVLGRREQPQGTSYPAGAALDTAAESPGINAEAVAKSAWALSNTSVPPMAGLPWACWSSTC